MMAAVSPMMHFLFFSDLISGLAGFAARGLKFERSAPTEVSRLYLSKLSYFYLTSKIVQLIRVYV